jgi:hypothetical protein
MVRFKNRYLLAEMVSPLSKSELPKIEAKDLGKLLRDSIQLHFGNYALGLLAHTLRGNLSSSPSLPPPLPLPIHLPFFPFFLSSSSTLHPTSSILPPLFLPLLLQFGI